MEEYKLFKQNVFESTAKFEKRLNEICQKGWNPISLSNDHGAVIILLQKSEKYNHY